ncbi:hypothetical protein BDV26DRAFT_257403 [Aspergillus bertholletiae]|uniref:Zn(2)-C6 fungal-type domain-containing protein n=1 Tax=Aspergillus bertholletiae TaxID=1226010 RepID=A0A5N7BFD9_9EURO|nr:hypothetical protein BDV26DRAFT_257403 [Aspergillus bertholletiae]
MYKPAPQRQKKTNIVRSRSGCKACRQRRVKCDEKKPSCSACMRRGKKCEAITPNLDFRTSIVLATEQHAVRHPKRLKVVYVKDTPIHSTVAGNEANDAILNGVSDDSNRSEDVPTFVPRRMSDGLVSIGQSASQSPVLSSLLPLPSPIQRRCLYRSGCELFYLTYWENSCARSLPIFFRQIASMANRHATLMQALLALSACNMSRSSPEGGGEVSSTQVTYRPRREYLLSSQHYYGSAVEQIARSIRRNSLGSPLHTLAVLVLFCYFESSMGNFAGFSCHADGIDTLIQTHFTTIASDHLGPELIAAWIVAKNHNWWLRMNFSSFSLQLSQGCLSLSSDISKILHSINAQRAEITSILCESYRINNLTLLQLGPCGIQQSNLTVDECITSLQIESRKLDEWHATLPHSELPIESFSSFEALDQRSIRPLLFTSHAVAMNYAYYACSRIMQCTALFHDLQRPYDPSNDAETEATHWMGILLRVVAGLNRQDCFRENVYSIGIASLFPVCLLRCHNVAFGRWVENWLSEWSKVCTLEEGSFPITQALEITRIINQENVAGNDIYAVALPEDDGGGRGKYTSYASQRFDKIILIGRRGSSGQMYSELVPVQIGS